jgi:hypothetical protein
MDVARQLAKGISPSDPNDEHFWRWLGPKFRVGPYADASVPAPEVARDRF